MHKLTLYNEAVHEVLSIIMGLGALIYLFSLSWSLKLGVYLGKQKL